jgi:hypothetical protein
MNGSRICVMPTMTAKALLSNGSGPAARPPHCASEFTTPCRPSRIIHAYVRTSRLMENGSATQSMISVTTRGRDVVRRYATGYPSPRHSSVTSALDLRVTSMTAT